MTLPESLWDKIKERAEAIRFGSITINLNEDSGAITLTTKIDERLSKEGDK